MHIILDDMENGRKKKTKAIHKLREYSQNYAKAAQSLTVKVSDNRANKKQRTKSPTKSAVRHHESDTPAAEMEVTVDEITVAAPVKTAAKKTRKHAATAPSAATAEINARDRHGAGTASTTATVTATTAITTGPGAAAGVRRTRRNASNNVDAAEEISDSDPAIMMKKKMKTSESTSSDSPMSNSSREDRLLEMLAKEQQNTQLAIQQSATANRTAEIMAQNNTIMAENTTTVVRTNDANSAALREWASQQLQFLRIIHKKDGNVSECDSQSQTDSMKTAPVQQPITVTVPPSDSAAALPAAIANGPGQCHRDGPGSNIGRQSGERPQHCQYEYSDEAQRPRYQYFSPSDSFPSRPKYENFSWKPSEPSPHHYNYNNNYYNSSSGFGPAAAPQSQMPPGAVAPFYHHVSPQQYFPSPGPGPVTVAAAAPPSHHHHHCYHNYAPAPVAPPPPPPPAPQCHSLPVTVPLPFAPNHYTFKF